MKISQIVKTLNLVKKQYGDVEVFLSSDSEGNGYATAGKQSSDCIYFDETKVIIYPFHEGLDYADLPQSKDDKQDDETIEGIKNESSI